MSFPGHWNNPDVRGALIAMHGSVCAYCSRRLERYDDLEVEHFRPKKGGYWWLAYDFANYFLSCSTCNGVATKGSKFPLLEADAIRVVWQTRHHLAVERRSLVDPALDTWIENGLGVPDNSGILAIQPHLTADQTSSLKVTLDFFSLNNDPITLKARAALFDETVMRLGDRDFSTVRQKACRSQPYSVVVRELLRKYAPAELPEPVEEVRCLMREIIQILVTSLEIIKVQPQADRARKTAESLLWALAVIWKDPQAGSPGEIENYLEGYPAIAAAVRTRFERL